MSPASPADVTPIIDTNVYLSRWPCRRLPFDETQQLIDQLRQHGVTQAWAGSFDALLHKDVEGVNRRVAAECRQLGDGLLLPVGCVNPTLPDWQEDVRRCAEEHQMQIIRLHPNYHQYPLTDVRFAELLDLTLQHQLIVQIAIRMEDTRTQHPLLRVPDVDVSPLPALLKTRSALRLMLLNSLQVVRGPLLAELASLPNVALEIATQEGVGGISRLLSQFPLERVLFGSYFPFFVLQSSLLKLQESELGAEIHNLITHRNAERFLNRQIDVRSPAD